MAWSRCQDFSAENLRNSPSPQGLAPHARGHKRCPESHRRPLLRSLHTRVGTRILNYLDHRLTHDFLESKNSHVKVIMRTTHGCRNMENVRLRISMTTRDDAYAVGALPQTCRPGTVREPHLATKPL